MSNRNVQALTSYCSGDGQVRLVLGAGGGISILVDSPIGILPEGLISKYLPTFSWDEVAVAEQYELLLIDLTDGCSVVIDEVLSDSSVLSSVSLVVDHDYAVLVRTVNDSGTGEYSEPTYFTVIATTVTISAPAISNPNAAIVTTVVTSTEDTPTGNITLVYGTGLAVHALVGGTGVFTITSLPSGYYDLTATYAAQAGFTGGSQTGQLMVRASGT